MINSRFVTLIIKDSNYIPIFARIPTLIGMNKLSKRIEALSESQTIKMARMSRELKSKGIDIINLSLGEPDFPTPSHIKEAATKAIEDNFSYYTAVAGIEPLRKAISEKFKRDNGLDYAPSQIVCSTGAKQSIANVALCLLNPEDEVLIPTPYWVSYGEIVKLAEAKPVFVETTIENKFKITAKQLDEALTEKTKLFIFSAPSNPTGSIYSQTELAELVKVFEKYPNCFILSDEIYEYINYVGKHESIASFDSIKDRVIVVNGFSKAFAMTGWRIGYMAGPQWIADAVDKMQGQFTSATCSITQMAATVAYDDMTPTFEMREAFQRRKDLTIKMVSDIPGIITYDPDGAFYLFPDVKSYFGKSYNGKKIKNSTDLALFILKEGHVALVTGDAFGSPNCIRISFATSEENLIEAFTRLKNTLALLN